MTEIKTLAGKIRAIKEREEALYLGREKLEAQLIEALGIDQEEGTKTDKKHGFKIVITQKINRTVDGDLLQAIAKEKGLSEHLSTLFRWKPSIEMKAWKAASETITEPLLGAITAKYGKPSVKIELLEDK